MKMAMRMTGLPARGFTLLEMIVVIGIFGIFATMAYGGLNSILKTRVRVDEALARTEEYDRAYLRLRSDFQNAVVRPVRSVDGNVLPTFGFDSYNQRIEFTRGGWLNLLSLPRATLERVSYSIEEQKEEPGARRTTRLDDRRLVRRSWNVLDRAPQTEPVEVVLLDHVQKLEWRFLDVNLTPSEGWPAQSGGPRSADPKQPPPTAIELRLQTRDWGAMNFLFRVGAEGAADIEQLSQLPVPPPAPGTEKPQPPPDPDNPSDPRDPPPPPPQEENPTQ